MQPMRDGARASSEHASPLPDWSTVVRAIRLARGVTQEGFAAQLGFSRRTVRRWERGEAVPDAAAERALLAYCRDHALFRRFAQGPLQGMQLTPELLRDLLAEARLSASAEAAPSPPVPLAFAPARAASTNLPAPLTSFVGRERELEELAPLLDSSRLVTLTGPGGTGKTRVALALAERAQERYPDGAWFVDLSSTVDAALVASGIAQALGVRESEGQSLSASVTAHLREN